MNPIDAAAQSGIVFRIKSSWWGKIYADHDTEPTEFMGGCFKLWLGFWLCIPWLDTVHSSATFINFDVLPEWLWGSMLLFFGVVHLWAIKTGNTRRRALSSFVGFLIWFTMSVTFVFANPPAIGWVGFAVFAVLQGWCTIRLRQLHNASVTVTD